MATIHILCLVWLYPLATWALQNFQQNRDSQLDADIKTTLAQFSAKKTVWVLAGARTGSSTVLSMLSATPDDNRNGTDVFSLYEPCHQHDEYNYKVKEFPQKKYPWGWTKNTETKLCGYVVDDVSKCNFKNILKLHGWHNAHNSNEGTEEYDAEIATRRCKAAPMIAVKTIDEIQTADVSWVLEKNPNMHIIEVVRDPRGLYEARDRLATENIQTHKKDKREEFSSFNTKSMDRFCEIYANNLNFKHPRVTQLVFDDMVVDPLTTAKKAYKFLGLPWTEKQDEWVRATFNNADCGTGQDSKSAHRDCRSDSSTGATRWHDELPSEIKQHFDQNEDCVKVALHYRFSK